MSRHFSLRTLLLGSLRRQLMAGMGIVVSLMMAMLVWQWAARQHADLKNQHTEQAIALAESIALSSSVWVASRDVAGLQEIATNSAGYPDVRFVILLDRQGQVLAHSDPAFLGKFMPDLPASASAETTIIQNASSLLDLASPVMLDQEHLGWVRIGIGRTQLDTRIKELLKSGLIYLLWRLDDCVFCVGDRPLFHPSPECDQPGRRGGAHRRYQPAGAHAGDR